MYDQSADSILNTIKILLGLSEDDTSFDQDVLIHINSVFLVLEQLGVGPESGYSIFDSQDVWSDFIEDEILLNYLKTYIYLKVKLVFDPPSNSTVLESINRQIDQFEWRICQAAETLKKGS